jgi:signal transduction histidine kinase
MVVTRDQLLIDVSHELRSPLTRMKVALELLPYDAQKTRLTGDVAEMERMISVCSSSSVSARARA